MVAVSRKCVEAGRHAAAPLGAGEGVVGRRHLTARPTTESILWQGDRVQGLGGRMRRFLCLGQVPFQWPAAAIFVRAAAACPEPVASWCFSGDTSMALPRRDLLGPSRRHNAHTQRRIHTAHARDTQVRAALPDVRLPSSRIHEPRTSPSCHIERARARAPPWKAVS